MNDIRVLKIVIKFKKEIKNIQRTLDQISHRQEQICPILDCPVHSLQNVKHHVVLLLLLLLLLINFILKLQKRTRNELSVISSHIVINISDFF